MRPAATRAREEIAIEVFHHVVYAAAAGLAYEPIGRRTQTDRAQAAKKVPEMAVADTAAELLDLLDWKRRIFRLYAEVRASSDPEAAWRRWRDVRDDLYRNHPQSPLRPEDRAGFEGSSYFPYDPDLRVLAEVTPAPAATPGDPRQRGLRDLLPPLRTRRLRARRRGARAGAPLAGGLRGRRLSRLHGRDDRARDLRWRPLPLRHRQGRRPRERCGPARARLQLRLQPVVLVRRPLGVPARAAREPARTPDPRRRAADRCSTRPGRRSALASAR